ncbi:hypothetical protein QTP88_027844 [Uroleucon formosanum]
MIGTINGKKPRGRPRQRWIDIVKSDLEECAPGLKLEDEEKFIYGLFMVNFLFLITIQAMEKNNASATDVVNIPRKLQNNIIERKDAKFVPLGAKKVLNTLTDEETNILKIEEDFKLFYDQFIAYIRLWENSFGDASTFFWVDENEIKWDHFLKASEIINLRLESEIVNQDQLFDEVLAKEFWLLKVKDWKEEEIKTKIKITSEEKWIAVFIRVCVADGVFASVFRFSFNVPFESAAVSARGPNLFENELSGNPGVLLTGYPRKPSTYRGLVVDPQNRNTV